jgi:glycosyltransferase involved in cell wall biosynthesis
LRVCSPELGIDPEANLGGAVYDRELLIALATLDVELSILLPHGESADSSPRWQITRTPRHRRSYYEYNWIFHRALRQEFRRRRFDLLRVHSPYSVGVGALTFARRTRIPAVLHYLHVEPRLSWQMVDRLTLHRYAHVVTISEATRHELLATYHLDPAKVSVVYPGVSDKYSPGSADRELRHRWNDVPVALYIGSLIARKNLQLAILTVARLRTAGVFLRLVLAGTGDDEPRLRGEVERLQLGDRVEFLGRVSENEKLALLRSADLFVFPSTREGFGMAAVEAMACGLPVVALRSGPIVEIMGDGAGGVLVDPGNAMEGFEAAFRRLLTDNHLRDRLRTAARSRAATFSWQRSAEQVLEIYRQVSSHGGA